MTWEFEHWDNGKVYLHQERWREFFKRVNKTGLGYPHDWDHNRIFTKIHSPRDTLDEVESLLGFPSAKKYKKVRSYAKYNVIYETYPAFARTRFDPEGWLPSWHIWAEDNRKDGEPLTIFTVDLFDDEEDQSFTRTFLSIPVPKWMYVASFRKQLWNMESYTDYGLGTQEPPKIKKKNTDQYLNQLKGMDNENFKCGML